MTNEGASVDETKVESGSTLQDAPTPGQPKSIVLFSDGTGNSSAKLFKTNVWRMYEAVDLGPSSPGKQDQVSFYDNGVGSTGSSGWAMLTGVFGWGLKRNVLDLYRYACRTYRPGPNQGRGANPQGAGDQIYGFGFSRGGFTMRLVSALIASQGLVTAADEAELARRSKEAFRAFRADFVPNKFPWPTRWLRAIGTWRSERRRRKEGLGPYNPSDNYHPVIRFLGIWDTVAAYGGPITEITRAVDDWIYPLSMPDYKLSPKVRCARHALSIDDQRDAFQPLLWDELHEQTLIESGEVAPDRLRQVWFTGMHADVGGGYPDESLSYVSFLWMLEEAEKAGLRTLAVVTERIRALASSYGPLHDSRAGLAAYYRYQPRRIGAWVEPPDPDTVVFRDPGMRRGRQAGTGLLKTVHVHESVIARIFSGTDSYAPTNLPANLVVDPPQAEGENAPQRDNEAAAAEPEPGAALPLIPDDVRSRAEDAELGKRRALLNERIWDSVWWRRAIYFATLAATAALATLPWWIRRWDPADKLCSDDRCILPPLIETLGGFLPGFASRWIAVFADKAVLSGVLLALIVGLIMVGKRLERRMHDRSRHFWRAALAGAAWPKPERAPVARWVRTNAFYQRMLGGAKWHVMPTVIAGAAFVAFFYVTLIAINQAYLAYGEPRGTFCNSNIQAPSANGQRVEFLVERPCNWAGTDVTATQAYLVTIDLPEYRDGGVERWRDGGHPTLPDGLTAGEVSMGRIGAPFRRVVSANYLQPLIEIRAHGGEESSLPSVHISALHLRQSEDYASRFLGAFCAARTGRLFVFANDVAGPFGLTSYTYGNNEGRGRIQVTPLGLKLPAGVERPQCEGSTD